MEKIKEKAVRAVAVYEVIGKPADFIEKVMENFLERIKEKKDVELIKKRILPVKKIENTEVYSIVADVELYVKDFESLLGFIIDTLPASIHIVEPAEIRFDLATINGFLSDYLAVLHNYHENFNKLKLEKEILMNKIKELEERLKKEKN
jgi:truncated hemoglobin YjbI